MASQAEVRDLKPLTQTERQRAREAARKVAVRAAGKRPERRHFARQHQPQYPPLLTRLIVVLCLCLLLAAFTASALRLYHIGSRTFAATIPDAASAKAVGVATVLSAEIGQIVFSLALAVLGGTKTSRRLLFFGMALATAIALVGNVQVALPGHWGNPFAWLEAVAPPLLVLSTAYVLKGQLLIAIRTRHANEQAFQSALAAWQAERADPEQHPHWLQFYANALRDALRAKARRSEGGRRALAAMGVDDWRQVVAREMAAEHWYVPPDARGRQALPPASADGQGEKPDPFADTAPAMGATSAGRGNASGHGARDGNG